MAQGPIFVDLVSDDEDNDAVVQAASPPRIPPAQPVPSRPVPSRPAPCPVANISCQNGTSNHSPHLTNSPEPTPQYFNGGQENHPDHSSSQIDKALKEALVRDRASLRGHFLRAYGNALVDEIKKNLEELFATQDPATAQQMIALTGQLLKDCDRRRRNGPSRIYSRCEPVRYHDDDECKVVEIRPRNGGTSTNTSSENDISLRPYNSSDDKEPEPSGNFSVCLSPISKTLHDKILQISNERNKPYSKHKCSSKCIPNSLPVHENHEIKLRGIPCFMVPLCFGFKRLFMEHEKLNSRHPAKPTYIYVAPCGVKLRSVDEVAQFLQISNLKFLDIDNFTCEAIDISLPKDIFKPTRCYYQLADLSYESEAQPIPVINSIDQTTLDVRNYKYFPERIVPYEELGVCESGFASCCDCEDNCQDPEKCACIQLTRKSYDIIPNMAKLYTTQYRLPLGYEHKRLPDHALFGIYECNSKCTCNSRCPNKVVQNGIKVQLEVFRTLRKGWGVRCKQDIPRGAFITTYSARVYTDDNIEGEDIYFADLDFIACAEATKSEYEAAPIEDISSDEDEEEECQPSSLSSFKDMSLAGESTKSNGRRTSNRKCKEAARDLITKMAAHSLEYESSRSTSRSSISSGKPLWTFFPENPFVLDAKHEGNLGRFLNHSCDPNCFVQSVFIETHDPRLPHVCLFAKKNIKAFEELTWDYQYKIDSVPQRTLYCHCGKSNCRKRLL